MKPISLLTGVSIVVVLSVAPSVIPHETGQTFSFGVYDPSLDCLQEYQMTYRHLFLSWSSYEPGVLRQKLQAIGSRGQRPLLTLEPWPDRSVTSRPSNLLTDIASGKYDKRIKQLALEIAAFRAPLLLSWGQEMENANGRYPWATSNPALYQEAYRHFVSVSRLSASNISYVWSPVGDKGLERYWPGETYVDYVGVSVFEFPAYDQAYYHQATRSFRDQMSEKYARVAKFQKPIIISECGVTGSKDYQISWLSGALRDLGNYPLLKALIYFNAKDTPGAWGKDFEAPDWRISGCGLEDAIGNY